MIDQMVMNTIVEVSKNKHKSSDTTLGDDGDDGDDDDDDDDDDIHSYPLGN